MDEEDVEDIDEDYVLTSRLEAGLFTLQQSALIMGNLWFHNDIHLRKRILLLLHQQVWRPLLCPLEAAHHLEPLHPRPMHLPSITHIPIVIFLVLASSISFTIALARWPCPAGFDAGGCTAQAEGVP